MVALPLHQFYRRRNGRRAFDNRAHMESFFQIAAGTRVVLVGSGRDQAIEAWWGLSKNRISLLEDLKLLEIDLITTPNYSLFTDEVRYNDLYNMKRIGTVWREITHAGIAAAYHLNARTETDYSRLSSFIDRREEIADVSFEFGTGAAWPQRLDFHLKQLSELAARVQHPLQLTMIGGISAIPSLVGHFSKIVYVDTSAFMNSMHRQRLYLSNNGALRKLPEYTALGHPVDGLLRDNIDLMRSRISTLISAAQLKSG